jgi:RNA polymerase sigma factor (TIGR02999 family)
MSGEISEPLTRLLAEAAAGDPQAAEELLPVVYDTLKEIARHRMAAERPDHTLQATALVNECYLRLFGNSSHQFVARAQFFYAAADAMHRILVEHARSRGRAKRGGQMKRVPLNVLDLAAAPEPAQILEFDQALTRLAEESPETAIVVRLRFFAGLSVQETADAMNVSTRTINREWAYARAWLYDALQES